jgi:hypothetical protein
MLSKKSCILLQLLFLFFVGCSPNYSRYIQSYQPNSRDSIPDYSNLFYWAAHPWKKDPSDSIPQPLRKQYIKDSTVDVFFLHPTTLTDPTDQRWNAGINDSFINAKTDYSTILFQASVFNEFRVFAPRYRQAHIRSYFNADTAKALTAFELAYQDIKTSFQYYLAHYNNGRPIIIASHSQGSTHAQRLLKEFFENNELKSRLIVAYVVGMYIPNNYFSELIMCKDSLQTGCLCGWRSFKKGYEPDFVRKENGTGLITNPITWTTTDEVASNTLNKGSVLFNFNKIKLNVAGAEIHDGLLWIDKLHIPGSFLVKRKNFHVGDINIFYLNIREDADRRVRLFRKK